MEASYRDKLRERGVSLVAVEGNIGVGKTSLARKLADSLGAKLVEEVVEDNPFLERFYEDMGNFAFQTQLVFLMNRYRQQLQLAQKDLFDEIVVMDYLFARDRIFANVNLTDEELLLYDRIADELAKKTVKPDLVLYLQASTETLFERIRKRGRSFERNISREYLETLNEAFDHFFFEYDQSPLLVVNTDAVDFVGNDEHYRDLLARIVEPVIGTEYYVPSWEQP